MLSAFFMNNEGGFITEKSDSRFFISPGELTTVAFGILIASVSTNSSSSCIFGEMSSGSFFSGFAIEAFRSSMLAPAKRARKALALAGRSPRPAAGIDHNPAEFAFSLAAIFALDALTSDPIMEDTGANLASRLGEERMVVAAGLLA